MVFAPQVAVRSPTDPNDLGWARLGHPTSACRELLATIACGRGRPGRATAASHAPRRVDSATTQVVPAAIGRW